MPRGIPNSPVSRQSPFDDADEGVLAGDVPTTQVSTAELMRREAAMEFTAEFERQNPVAGDKIERKRHLTYMRMGVTCPRTPCKSNAHDIRKNWIVVGIGTLGPYGPEQQLDQLKALHGVSLEDTYGQWPQNNMAFGLEQLGLNWADFDEKYPYGPFTELFNRGGVHEMPIDQFMQLGFHRNPMAARYRMKEIEQMRLYTCEICHPSEHKEFLEPAHLDNHNAAKHTELVAARANARETSKVIGELLLKRENGQDDVLPDSQILNELLATRAAMAAMQEQLDALTAKGVN